jgi:hypothetical protein
MHLQTTQSFVYTATALDVNGSIVNGVNFRWSSDNPSSVSVNQTTGEVTANSPGGANIFAAAILADNSDGPAGVGAVTVDPRGAIMTTVNLQAGPSTIAAGGATLRAYQNGVLIGVGYVGVAASTPGRGYIPGLEPGTYTVTVSFPTYTLRTFENVVVTSNSVTSLNGGATVVLFHE